MIYFLLQLAMALDAHFYVLDAGEEVLVLEADVVV